MARTGVYAYHNSSLAARISQRPWPFPKHREHFMARQPIQSADAPQAIGTYSQAVRAGSTIYLSGQIALDPKSMTLAEGIDFESDPFSVFSARAGAAALASDFGFGDLASAPGCPVM